MTVDTLKVGPYGFTYVPDGDDPGTGWLRVWDDFSILGQMPTTRRDWDAFVLTLDDELSDTEALLRLVEAGRQIAGDAMTDRAILNIRERYG